MEKYHILYNPLAGNGIGKAKAEELKEKLQGDLDFIDITAISDYGDFFASIGDESIVIIGGDGTLNRFINDTENIRKDNDIYFYAAGTGNDLLRDLPKNESGIYLMNEYIKELPICEVNGKRYRFINGIGFGIDGYCCEIGDEQRKIPDKKINYAGIAIKGLLFHYKPCKAKVSIDDKEYIFNKVWLAPTMNGRFYGGGLMPTPDQDRLDPEKKVSVFLFHDSGKIKTLSIFPSIFKGEHLKHKDVTAVFKGSRISVEFDSPRSLQIDGETILGVKKYSVYTASCSENKEDFAFSEAKA